MCFKIFEVVGKFNMDEYNFFFRGGVVCILFVNGDFFEKNSLGYCWSLYVKLGF